jgi:hypothetical protein
MRLPEMRLRSFLFAVGIASVDAGCLGQIIPAHETAEEPRVQLVLSQHSFQGAGFSRVGRAAFDSVLEPAKKVTMFVSREAAAAYAAVRPEEASAAGPSFPVGGVIVRYVTDPAGAPTGLTVMVKREPGYYPESGDFFFGVTDLEGVPVEGEDGVEWGRLASCGSCHHTRASAGYLFGVAQADR